MRYGTKIKLPEGHAMLYKSVQTDSGELTSRKRSLAGDIYEFITLFMIEMVKDAISTWEPLRFTEDWKSEVQGMLCAFQKDRHRDKPVLWREAARLKVQDALTEQTSRYLKYLYGCVRNVEQPTAGAWEAKVERDTGELVYPDKPQLKYYHIPVDVQDAITPQEISDLAWLAADEKFAIPKGEKDVNVKVSGFNSILDVFRLCICRDWSNIPFLTESQIAVLKYIHGKAQSRCGRSEFNKDGEFVLTIPIDARMLIKTQKDIPAELKCAADALLLCDNKNSRYKTFLDLPGMAPNGDRLRVPVTLNRKLAKLSEFSGDKASLMLQLYHSGRASVRMVVQQQVEVKDTVDAVLPLLYSKSKDGYIYVTGGDWGYNVTRAISVWRIPVAALPANPADMKKRLEFLASMTKEQAKEFYLTHKAPTGAEIVESRLFDGVDFMAKAGVYSERIAFKSSRIDKLYNELEVVLADLRGKRGLSETDMISPSMKRHIVYGALARRFFELLGWIKDAKQSRRKLYKKIGALRKSWFGHIINQYIGLANKYHAVTFTEKLTLDKIEKDFPEYKGKAFNKMIVTGSRGIYMSEEARKMQWNGVPRIGLQPYYTSRACTEHSAICNRGIRKGTRLKMPCCMKVFHADEHASATIGIAPFLVSNELQSCCT